MCPLPYLILPLMSLFSTRWHITYYCCLCKNVAGLHPFLGHFCGSCLFFMCVVILSLHVGYSPDTLYALILQYPLATKPTLTEHQPTSIMIVKQQTFTECECLLHSVHWMQHSCMHSAFVHAFSEWTVHSHRSKIQTQFKPLLRISKRLTSSVTLDLMKQLSDEAAEVGLQS